MPSSKSQLILLTGGSGLLGSHILLQLLEKGYRVRATARGAKVDELRASNSEYLGQLEVVNVADITEGQFPEVFVGVDAVIHTATPMPARNSAEEVLKGAVEGTVNIVRQADKAGITKIVVTSSIATVFNPSGSFTDKDWNPVTKEESVKLTGMNAYAAAKTLAEQELWAYADAHPHLDVTTLNPPLLYGSLARTFHAADPAALSSMGYIYGLLFPSGAYPDIAPYFDVRDAAKAHVLALDSPSHSVVGRKRIVIGSPFGLNFGEVKALLKKERPEVFSRWSTAEIPAHPFTKIDSDWKRINEVLGLKESDCFSVKETILDAVDSLLALEKDWGRQ